jgi:hypothetical protein
VLSNDSVTWTYRSNTVDNVSLHLHFLFCLYRALLCAMNANLKTVHDFYASTWLNMPFSNILNLEALFLAMDDPGVVSAFLDGNSAFSDIGSFFSVAKDGLHLSEEEGTCGSFAIITGEKLDCNGWSSHYVHTGGHGGMVGWTVQSPTRHYLIDSLLRSAYEIPLSGFLWSPGHHIYSTYLFAPPSPTGSHSLPILCFSSSDREM